MAWGKRTLLTALIELLSSRTGSAAPMSLLKPIITVQRQILHEQSKFPGATGVRRGV
jgi:hypothetical protein